MSKGATAQLIPLTLVIVGGIMIYSGMQGQNPVTVAKNVLTGVPITKGPNAPGSLGTAGAGVQTQTNAAGVTSQAGTSAGSDAPFNQATTPTGGESTTVTPSQGSYTPSPHSQNNFTPDGNGGFTVTPK